MRNPTVVELLIHEDGVHVPDLDPIYEHRFVHDPSNLHEARRLAEANDRIRLGVLYRNPQAPRYEDLRRLPAHTAEEKIALLSEELDRYAV